MDDDYVEQILQKYRLAVSLAVIRNKPNNVSLEDYIDELRSKITGSQKDETLSNISVNEEDFDFSDDSLKNVANDLNYENSNDSITILRNYDFNDLNITSEDENLLIDVIPTKNNYKSFPEENTIVEELLTPDLTPSINFDDNLNKNSQHNLNIHNTNKDSETILEYSKTNDTNIKEKVNNNLTKDLVETEESQLQNIITDFNIYDSQETEIYTLHGFAELNTHISQSQDNFVIAQNFLVNKNKVKNNKSIENFNNEVITINVAETSQTNYHNDEKKINNIDDSEIQLHRRKKLKSIKYTESIDLHNTRNNKNISSLSQDNSENSQDLNKSYIQVLNRKDTLTQDSLMFSLTSQESSKLNLINLSQDLPKINNQNGSLDFGFLNNSKTSKSASKNSLEFGLSTTQNEISTNIEKFDESKKFNSDQSLILDPIAYNSLDSLNLSQNDDDDLRHNISNNFNEHSNKVMTRSFNSGQEKLNKRYNTLSNDPFSTNYNLIVQNSEEIESHHSERCHIDLEFSKNALIHLNKNSFVKSDIISDTQFFTPNTSTEYNLRTLDPNERTERKELLLKERTQSDNLKLSITEDKRNDFTNHNSERQELLNETKIQSDNSKLSTTEDKTKEFERVELNKRTESDSDIEMYPDLSDSQAEVVPFKVMEELNKIKVYLNKRNRLDSDSRTDSGYKSSSRGSLYSASQTDIWVNQSSNCLFSYLSECPLLMSTTDINYEIAKVLGTLIDKLHEDEKYPTFLEEMLEFIHNLLKNVCEGKCEGEIENIFLKNDERIDRLLLLNKSQNVIKFTIEKITNILEKFVDNLQNGGHVELDDVNSAENLCFIFHLLEILLKKYSLKFSQSSQPSQEIVLKKSTLTEIWRKRWNLSKSEVFQREAVHDITARCSDVLNKVIVKSMDGYSLVAYAALQCFNLLQS